MILVTHCAAHHSAADMEDAGICTIIDLRQRHSSCGRAELAFIKQVQQQATKVKAVWWFPVALDNRPPPTTAGTRSLGARIRQAPVPAHAAGGVRQLFLRLGAGVWRGRHRVPRCDCSLHHHRTHGAPCMSPQWTSSTATFSGLFFTPCPALSSTRSCRPSSPARPRTKSWLRLLPMTLTLGTSSSTKHCLTRCVRVGACFCVF